MKRLFLLFSIALLSIPWAAGARADLSLQRATLTVNDMDASIAFYRDVLGFTVSGDAAYDTPALRTMFHVPDGAVPRLVLLDAGTEQPRALALVAAEGLTVDRDANRRHAPAIVLNVADLDMIQARMQAAAATEVLPPTPLNDFQGRPFGREALYLDPDGVRIVLFERIDAP